MVGDAICHDETNHLGCNYDGGDCCGSNVAIDNCTECACHGKGIFINILSLLAQAAFYPKRIHDERESSSISNHPIAFCVITFEPIEVHTPFSTSK